METDGLETLSVPPSTFQDFADRLPRDYDVLVLNHAGAGPGALYDTFNGRNRIQAAAAGVVAGVGNGAALNPKLLNPKP
jgi:hypothetical protein